MRTSFFRLSVAILAFAVGTFTAPWFRPSDSRAFTSAQSLIPDGWTKIDLDSFSFFAPSDLKNQKVRGIDSTVWKFRNREMTLDLDYGRYSNDLQFYADQPDYHTEWLRIDGKKAKIASWRMSDAYLADCPKKGRGYVAAVYFPDLGGSGTTKLTFWASCIDSATRDSARKVFLSVRFR